MCIRKTFLGSYVRIIFMNQLVGAIVSLFLVAVVVAFFSPFLLALEGYAIYIGLFIGGIIVAYQFRVFFLWLSLPIVIFFLYLFMAYGVTESKIIYSLRENNNKLVLEELFTNLEQTPLVRTDESCGWNCAITYDVINSMLDDGDLRFDGEKSEEIKLNQEILLAEKELVDFKNLFIIWNEIIWPAFQKILIYMLWVAGVIFLLPLLLMVFFLVHGAIYPEYSILKTIQDQPKNRNQKKKKTKKGDRKKNKEKEQ